LPALLPFFLIYEIPGLQELFSGDLDAVLRYAPLKLLEYRDIIQTIIALGTLITALALLTLRRAFSIMTEARILVCRGIYAYINHPMYLGQFITFFGVACFRNSLEKWSIYLVFLALQWVRMKNEERKLKESFTEYKNYRKNCWIRL
jgi:protein-S-isoprenylcysteine O-methyltransferase Ste14